MKKLKTRLQVNNFSHLTVQAKLYAAMRKSSSKSNHAKMHIITNKNNKPFAICHYVKGDTAQELLGRSSGFYFTDKDYHNITPMVLKSLQAA